MKTLTVNITDESRLALLEETLTELGFDYSVVNDNGYNFGDAEIASFLKTKQDYLDGKTTARSWGDIQKDPERPLPPQVTLR